MRSQIGQILNCDHKVQYGGNPEYKRNPGDFQLTPPSSPRPAKSSCNFVKVFTRKEALDLLRKGTKIGLVSDRFEGQWQKNVWSVMDNGIPRMASSWWRLLFEPLPPAGIKPSVDWRMAHELTASKPRVYLVKSHIRFRY